MPRKNPPEPLSTQTNSANNGATAIGQAPLSASSLKSPTSPRLLFGKSQSKSSENIHHKQQNSAPQLPYPETSMMPQSVDNEMQVRTPPVVGQGMSPQKNSFFGFKSSKSSNKLQQGESKRPATRDNLQSRENESGLQQSVTTGDLRTESKPRDEKLQRPQTSERTLSQNKSEPQLNKYIDSSAETKGLPRNETVPGQSVQPKRSKPKGIGGLLRRTNSTRNDFDSTSFDDRQPQQQLGVPEHEYNEGIRTAPIRETEDPAFREAVQASNNQTRNRSADRQPVERAEPQKSDFGRRLKDHRPAQSSVSLSKEASTSIMKSLKSAGSKAANRFGLGSHEKVGPTEPWVPRHVNLPLIEQTRATRISKMLETSRDKTEYWMPSLPWRCIDYLNYRGTDQEGLYRIPGSGREIARYQEKFDTELDVDLFQQRDLYDINIIGSLLKWWLRELPDELFPTDAQERVHRSLIPGHEYTSVPQTLIDELSNLPPYNYYLLFALTCHLSLVLEHQDKNKMTLENLRVCILPCLGFDPVCFRWLVGRWRECWKGCKTEGEWMDKERGWREGEQREMRGPAAVTGMRKGSVPGMTPAMSQVVQDSERMLHERNLSSNSEGTRPGTKAGNQERSRQGSREEAVTNGANHHSNSNGTSKNSSRERRNTTNNNSNTNGENRTEQLRMENPPALPPRVHTPPNQREASRGGPVEQFADAGKIDRSDLQQLLSPIQPMSPMHMPGSA